MIGAIIVLFIVFAIGSIGYRLGWNAACALYRDRTIDGAEHRYQDDIR